MTDAQSRVTAALEAAKAAVKTESAALNVLRQQAEAADDYRQIMNAMGKHVFGYYGQLQEEELEKYWSKRDDIVYAHGSMAYYGRENVYNYYTGMTSAMKAQGRAVAEKFYGEKFDPQYGPGYKVMNMLLSPYVEIAKDRQTARGVWIYVPPESGNRTAGNLLGTIPVFCRVYSGGWSVEALASGGPCGVRLGVPGHGDDGAAAQGRKERSACRRTAYSYHCLCGAKDAGTEIRHQFAL